MDPFLRWNLPRDAALARWDVAGAVGVLAVGRRDALTLTVLGAPPDAATLVATALAERADVERLTLPRGTLPLLTDQVARRIGDGADWDWWWTADSPAPQPGEDVVETVRDDEAIRALLVVASPRPDVAPGVPGLRVWLGVRAEGRLVACGALTERASGAGHLASIATSPAWRGRGLGGAVTAALTRRSLASGDAVCTLGMYADNGPARRMYLRLGYRRAHEFSSRALLP